MKQVHIIVKFLSFHNVNTNVVAMNVVRTPATALNALAI